MFDDFFSSLTLQQLNIFLVAARYDNFSRAAQVLFMTQASVSRNIAAIEETTGLILFNRHRQRVHLTAAGRTLAEEMNQVAHGFNMAVSTAFDVQANQQRILNIGDMDSIPSEMCLIPTLERFQEKYPEIEIRVKRGESAYILDDIHKGKLDAAFMIGAGVSRFAHENLAFHWIWRVSPCIVIGKKHPLFEKEQLCMADFSGSDVIMFDNRYHLDYWEKIRVYLSEKNFTVGTCRYVDVPHTMLLELQKGQEIAFMNVTFVASSSNILRAVEMEGCPKISGVGIVYEKDNKNPYLQALVKCGNQACQDKDSRII